ncbi:glycosyltransferase [Streptomyces sp. CA-106110]|uniref:glycosyltransferase n=1 Tax=Streptomyces sp. CA-106110 TaxID=3240044 RepID=UPI003D909F78
MSPTRRPILVAVSGPDGAGKSSLVDRMTPVLRDLGLHPVTAYCYGCVLCRRFPAFQQTRQPASGRGGWRRFSRVRSSVDRAHSLVDAAELAVRLTEAGLRARIRGRGRPTVVVTDRGPLDALVKFDPAPASPVATLFTRLADRYDAALLLDVAPEVLAARDREHTVDQLADYRHRYRRWGQRLPSVVRLDAGLRPSAVVREAVGAVLGDRPGAAAALGCPDATSARKHVVISSFDDTGNPHYHGGGAIVVEKVARRLSEDFRVTVVTAARRGDTRTRDGVSYRYLPVGWAGPRAGQLLFHALLPLVARRLPHDLWMESFTPPFSTSFLPLFSPARVLGIGQMLSGKTMWHKYHLPFFIVERFGLRFYRDVVTMNDVDREVVRRHSPAAVHVIPNGVDRRHIDEARLGQGEHILFLGRIDVHTKGVDLLLAAYAKASPSMPLVLAGSGTPAQEKRLAALLAKTGRNVRWLGQVGGARKQELLERSAFLVMPSRSESFGIAALEAMAYGKPVLHFDLPALRWMRGGDVGVPPFDVDELAAEMQRLAADEQLRRRLGQQAHLAAQRHTWEETTDRYLSLVRHLFGLPVPDAEGAATCEPIH